MGVFKEEVNALEDLAKKQVRIYPDSCDFGVVATDEVKDTMRWVIKSLLELDESEIVWRMDANGVTQRQYRLTVYFSLEDGITFNVLYFRDRKNEYFSIVSERAASKIDMAAVLYKEMDNVSDEERMFG